MLFGFPVLAIRICRWFEPRSTKIVNGLQGAAKRGFGDSNEFNLKGAAALVTKCAGMGQQGVGVGGQQEGHSGDFGNGAKFVWKMSKSVMQLISIRF